MNATPTCRFVALLLVRLLIEMAPKPPSTAGKALESTAGKVSIFQNNRKEEGHQEDSQDSDNGISNKAKAILNSFVNDIFKRITREALSKFTISFLIALITNSFRTRRIRQVTGHANANNTSKRPSHPNDRPSANAKPPRQCQRLRRRPRQTTMSTLTGF
jgi:hypothetical protein